MMVGLMLPINHRNAWDIPDVGIVWVCHCSLTIDTDNDVGDNCKMIGEL